MTESSNELDRTVVITVVTMGVVQVAIDDVVDVIPVGHSLMTASWSVYVVFIMTCAGVIGRAGVWIFLIHVKAVLIYVVSMHVMKMAVMNIVDVISMPNRCVATIRPMHVCVVHVFFARLI